MMGIETLIKRLNQYSQSLIAYKLGADFADACMDAATALSTLQAENEKLRAESIMHHNDADDYWYELNEYRQERNEALAELEQVKRERDAIEQDFRAFAKQWWEQDSGFPCRWCKFENSGGCEWKAKQPNEEKICAGRAFEWRGQKREG